MNQAIPVFVFPDALHFAGDARTKTLSLYNPYDFALRFQILSTNPNAFTLSSSEGVIRSRHCLDVVIRARESAPPLGARFLIKVTENVSQGARSGERQVMVTMSNESSPESSSTDQRFEACETLSLGGARIGSRRMEEEGASRPLNQTASVVAAMACCSALLLPHESDHWLSLSVTNKLVVAYVLGILTVLILRK